MQPPSNPSDHPLCLCAITHTGPPILLYVPFIPLPLCLVPPNPVIQPASFRSTHSVLLPLHSALCRCLPPAPFVSLLQPWCMPAPRYAPCVCVHVSTKRRVAKRTPTWRPHSAAHTSSCTHKRPQATLFQLQHTHAAAAAWSASAHISSRSRLCHASVCCTRTHPQPSSQAATMHGAEVLGGASASPSAALLIVRGGPLVAASSSVKTSMEKRANPHPSAASSTCRPNMRRIVAWAYGT